MRSKPEKGNKAHRQMLEHVYLWKTEKQCVVHIISELEEVSFTLLW